MDVLNIDIETKSATDIKKGVYKYCEDPEFNVLLFAYSFNGSPVKIIDLTRERLPDWILALLTDPNTIKRAYNAQFERVALSNYLRLNHYAYFINNVNGPFLDPVQWQCTLVKVAYMGLPLSLGDAAIALKLPIEKMKEGRELIRFFCVPRKPSKANPDLWNTPEKYPEKWLTFCAYCKTDVKVEMQIFDKISYYKVSKFEQHLYSIDQRVNDMGIRADIPFVQSIIEMNEIHQKQLIKESKILTGLSNPNSVPQLKKWVEDALDENLTDLSKDCIKELLEDENIQGRLRRVLQIRQETSKTSIKKFHSIAESVCADGRIRGTFQFYGAKRTGRWAGRIFQPHNLAKNELYPGQLRNARLIASTGNLQALQACYKNVSNTFSELIRPALIPAKGKRFIISDFAAIEARIIAWLAGESWRLEVFQAGGKIYEASAAKMLKIPVESIKNPSKERQTGKVAELALGFQGGRKALIRMGALKMGLEYEELTGIVKAWRRESPAIVQLWWDLQQAAIEAIETGEYIQLQYGLAFYMQAGNLHMRLPSGRCLTYYSAYVKDVLDTEYNKVRTVIHYQGSEDDSLVKTYLTQTTYGGKLVENAVQGIARDCLAEAITRLDDAGYPIPAHVHDEIITECIWGFGSIAELDRLMSQPIEWAKGLPLRVESFESDFYMKKN